MPRSRTRAQDGLSPAHLLQRFGIGIETVDEDAISPQVGGEGKAVRGIGHDTVGVRLALTIHYRAAPRVPDHGGRRTKCPVGSDRKQRDRTAVVVGDEDNPAALVDAHETRRGPVRLCCIHPGERAGTAGARERGHRTALDFIYGVEHTGLRVDREERRIRAGVDGANRPQLSRATVHAEEIHAVGSVLVGIGPDIQQVLVHAHLTLAQRDPKETER